MTRYIVDAYAWIEYFRGSPKAQEFRKLLMNSENNFITCDCTVAEIRLWAIRVNQDFNELFRVVQSNSSLSPITLHDWLNAAIARQKMRKTRERFGLIDALLLVKQREFKCRLISGDVHFNDLPAVIFLA